MKLNKRALLVEGIFIYEIILNYLLFPLDTLGSPAPVIIKIIFNTLLYGGLCTFMAIVIGVGIFYGIYYLIKWINEDTGNEK